MQLDHKLSPQDRPENNNFDLLENECIYGGSAERVRDYSLQCTMYGLID